MKDGDVPYNKWRTPERTTRGWSLLVQWKHGSTDWVPPKDMKESNPLKDADYAVAHQFKSDSAFAWWVPFTLKKRDHFI
jgi:hypothetical protein